MRDVSIILSTVSLGIKTLQLGFKITENFVSVFKLKKLLSKRNSGDIKKSGIISNAARGYS